VPEATIEVRLRPRGHADELIGLEAGVLRARVSAPPVDGKGQPSTLPPDRQAGRSGPLAGSSAVPSRATSWSASRAWSRERCWRLWRG